MEMPYFLPRELKTRVCLQDPLFTDELRACELRMRTREARTCGRA